MRFEVESVRGELVDRLHSHARSDPDGKLRAYVGSPVPVLGLSMGEIRGIAAEFKKAWRDLSIADLNELLSRLWSGSTYEEKVLATILMDRYARRLDKRTWRLVDSWVDQATGWALSDGLASGPIAKMLHEEPARFQQVLRWTKAKSFWRRRAATYALHDFVLAGELDRPFRLLERLLEDDEFWVQRAVGTWLRECWKQDRGRTERFLRAHRARLPPVTITVATERAPKTFREELRRKARRATSR
jgi:3-methyladenine DNA glycosylase AlkD